MARLIKLRDDLVVAADEVAALYLNAYRTAVIVVTKGGERHHVDPDYGSHAYKTLDRLTAEVNAGNNEVADHG